VYYPGLDTYSINNLNDQASLGISLKEILTWHGKSKSVPNWSWVWFRKVHRRICWLLF
jgi:hypothetical protein